MTPAEMLRDAFVSLRGAPEAERVEMYNACLRELGALVSDLVDAPVLSVQIVPAERLVANSYNPNRVAGPEVDLLEQSIRCDGLTMPVVAFPTPTGWEVVDGFHRRRVLTERLRRRWVPCSIIPGELGDRMASTVRHNRARGKHQVDLMAEIVRSLLEQGWADDKICAHVGMTADELLRLKQTVGVAALLARSEYSRSWEVAEPSAATPASGDEDHGEDPPL